MKIDLTLLYRLFDQNEVMVARFLDIFKTEVPGQLHNLRQAIAQQDTAASTLIAHGLKTQCRYMGLEEIAQQCERIERSPTAPEITEWLAQLENDIREVLSATGG